MIAATALFFLDVPVSLRTAAIAAAAAAAAVAYSFRRAALVVGVVVV